MRICTGQARTDAVGDPGSGAERAVCDTAGEGDGLGISFSPDEWNSRMNPRASVSASRVKCCQMKKHRFTPQHAVGAFATDEDDRRPGGTIS